MGALCTKADEPAQSRPAGKKSKKKGKKKGKGNTDGLTGVGPSGGKGADRYETGGGGGGKRGKGKAAPKKSSSSQKLPTPPSVDPFNDLQSDVSERSKGPSSGEHSNPLSPRGVLGSVPVATTDITSNASGDKMSDLPSMKIEVQKSESEEEPEQIQPKRRTSKRNSTGSKTLSDQNTNRRQSQTIIKKEIKLSDSTIPSNETSGVSSGSDFSNHRRRSQVQANNNKSKNTFSVSSSYHKSGHKNTSDDQVSKTSQSLDSSFTDDDQRKASSASTITRKRKADMTPDELAAHKQRKNIRRMQLWLMHAVYGVDTELSDWDARDHEALQVDLTGESSDSEFDVSRSASMVCSSDDTPNTTESRSQSNNGSVAY